MYNIVIEPVSMNIFERRPENKLFENSIKSVDDYYEKFQTSCTIISVTNIK